jgi:alpha-D-ribose 1-methylphosphonate 5-triphosphate synthase subunit PhnG
LRQARVRLLPTLFPRRSLPRTVRRDPYYPIVITSSTTRAHAHLVLRNERKITRPSNFRISQAMTGSESIRNDPPSEVLRSARLSLLARAHPAVLASLLAPWQNVERTWLRRPETGLVMVQGRTGGSGSRFNLGEMSATRCTLKLSACASTGVGWVAGRRPAHAEAVALADALLQSPAHRNRVQNEVVEPLIAQREAELAAQAARTASTKVEFFTMTRGE